MKKINNRLWVYVTLFLVSVAMVMFISFIMTNLVNSLRNEKSEFIIEISPTPTLKPSPTVKIKKDFSEIEKLFEDILNGEMVLVYDDDYKVKYWKKDVYDLADYDDDLNEILNLSLSAYEYVPGTEMTYGYEGLEWKISMDEWKKWLETIEVGETSPKKICNLWGCENSIKRNEIVSVKMINGNKYVRLDSYFKPSGSRIVEYWKYDSKYKYIIRLGFDFEYRDGGAVSEEIEKTIKRIEKLM